GVVIFGDGRKEEHASLHISWLTSVRWGQILELVHHLPEAITAHQIAEPATGIARSTLYGGIGAAANPDGGVRLLLWARCQRDVVELVIAPGIRHVLLAQHPRQDL